MATGLLRAVAGGVFGALAWRYMAPSARGGRGAPRRPRPAGWRAWELTPNVAVDGGRRALMPWSGSRTLDESGDGDEGLASIWWRGRSATTCVSCLYYPIVVVPLEAAHERSCGSGGEGGFVVRGECGGGDADEPSRRTASTSGGRACGGGRPMKTRASDPPRRDVIVALAQGHDRRLLSFCFLVLICDSIGSSSLREAQPSGPLTPRYDVHVRDAPNDVTPCRGGRRSSALARDSKWWGCWDSGG